MGRDRVGLFAAIREDHRQGMGVRAIARKHGVHRRTVREALASPVPAPRKVPERASPARDSVAPLIDAMLTADLDAPRKQRHTARRVWVAAARRARRGGVVLLCGEVRGPPPPGDRGGAEGAGGEPGGVRAAGEGAGGGGRGRLRAGHDHAGRPGGGLPPVRLPAVVLRDGGAPGLRLLRAGGAAGGARDRVRGDRRGPGGAYPLRQPDAGGDEGAAGPGPEGERPLAVVPDLVRVRRVLLRAGHRRALTRKAASRARSAGSAGTTWSPSRA